MTTHMERKILSKNEILLFDLIKDLTSSLLVKVEATCHSVCEAIAIQYPQFFTCHNGYFGEHHQHSWLRFVEASNVRDRFIIDAYPVAVHGGPFIADTGTHLIIPTPWNTLYRPI